MAAREAGLREMKERLLFDPAWNMARAAESSAESAPKKKKKVVRRKKRR